MFLQLMTLYQSINVGVDFLLREREVVSRRIYFQESDKSAPGTGTFVLAAKNTTVTATVTVFTEVWLSHYTYVYHILKGRDHFKSVMLKLYIRGCGPMVNVEARKTKLKFLKQILHSSWPFKHLLFCCS